MRRKRLAVASSARGLRQRSARLPFHDEGIAAVDGAVGAPIIAGHIVPEVDRVGRLTGAILRLLGVAAVHNPVPRTGNVSITLEHAHTDGHITTVGTVAHTVEPDGDHLRVGYASEIHRDRVAADSSHRYRASPGSHCRAAQGHGRGKGDDDLIVVRQSAAATFDSDRAARRQVDIEIARCRHGSCAKPRSRPSAPVFHPRRDPASSHCAYSRRCRS